MKKLVGLSLVVLLGLSLVGCGGSGANSGGSSSSEAAKSASSSEKAAAGFDSEEISDETINSIETYEDYLNKYHKIVDIFLVEYEAVFKKAGMDTDGTFASMKETYNQQLEEQKEQYASFGAEALTHKETFVQSLTQFRDNAKEALENVDAAS